MSGSWPGASPETVEAFLTSPIEAAVQLVDGVEDVTSESREGGATITALFDRNTDMDFARLDLAERITTLKESQLPPGIRVSVEQYVPREFQQGALLTYTFTGAHTLEALRAHLEDVVIPELSRVDGVSVVRAAGGLERMLEIEVDREAMAALGISTGEIAGRLSQLDLRGVAGAVRKGEYEWTVSIRDRPTSAEDIGNAIVRADRDRIIRVNDVAVVRDTWEDIERHYRINTRPAVQLFVYKEINANSVRVAELARERLAEVEARNPPNTRFVLNSDRSERIKEGISEVQNRVLLQLVAIFAVLLVFIGSVRSAVVMFSTIAFSILITLNFVYFAGLSLNQITLIGLAMGFGLVLDNSIVVLENIFRRWQQGHSREEATRRGASNVVLPIMAATGTNIIVLVPFVYLQGDQRVFYLPFGIVVGLSVRGLAPRGLQLHPGAGRQDPPGPPGEYGEGRSGLPRAPLYERFYRGMVTGSLRRPWLVVAVPILAFTGSSYLFFKHVNRGYAFTGGRDQPTYISININLPDGTDIERTDEFTKFFEARLNTMPEVGRFVSRVNKESSNIHVTFPRAVELTSKPVAIKDQLFAYSLLFSGIEVRVTGIGPSFYGGGGAYSPRYRLQVLGYNYLEVRRIAELLGSRLEAETRVDEVNTNASSGYGGEGPGHRIRGPHPPRHPGQARDDGAGPGLRDRSGGTGPGRRERHQDRRGRGPVPGEGRGEPGHRFRRTLRAARGHGFGPVASTWRPGGHLVPGDTGQHPPPRPAIRAFGRLRVQGTPEAGRRHLQHGHRRDAGTGGLHGQQERRLAVDKRGEDTDLHGAGRRDHPSSSC